MPAPSLAEIDPARIAAMDLADLLFESIGRLRNRDQIDMIGDPAVRPDLDLLSASPLSHHFQVALVIFVTRERLLSAVSLLSDVMGQTMCNDTRQSSRDQNLSSPRPSVNN
jgi:hypothetical protein